MAIAGVALCAVVVFLYALVRTPRSRRAGDTKLTIGVLVEHSARGIDSRFSHLRGLGNGTLSFREVHLGELPSERSGTGALPDSIDVLLVLGGGHLPDARLYEIDQFLMRGGRAAFFLDGASVSKDRTRAEVVRGNLFAYVGTYGATVEPDLVVDPQNSSQRYWDAPDAGRYAFWPLGQRGPGPAGDIMPAGDVVFTWCSSITVDGGNSASLDIVATSSESSWSTLAFAEIGPDLVPEPRPSLPDGSDGEKRGRRVMVVTLDGALESAFSGMPVIVETADGSVEFTDPPDRIVNGAPTRVVVGGSSTMFEDEVTALAPENLTFLTNVLEWLAER